MIDQIKKLLQSPEIIVATWRTARKTVKNITERQVADDLRRFDDLWAELFPAEQARIVQLLVARVDICEVGADITLKIGGLTSILADLRKSSDRRAAA